MAAPVGFRILAAMAESGDQQALFERALALSEAGDHGAALPLLAALSEHAEALPELFYFHGRALQETGQTAAAEALYRRALAAGVALTDLWTRLARLLADRGAFEDLQALMQEADRAPQEIRADALTALATAFEMADRPEQAAQAAERALALEPGRPVANLIAGVHAANTGLLAKAERHLKTVIAADPGHLDARHALAATLADSGRHEQAEALFRDLAEEQPEDARALCRLGGLRLEADDLKGGEALFRQAVARRPDNVEAAFRLADSLERQGRDADCLAAYDRVFELDPERPEAHFNVALIHLRRGEYAEAWPGYEYRFDCPDGPSRLSPAAPWDGRAFAGHLLVHCEQGFGDALQFVRYLALARSRVERLTLLSPVSLAALLATCPGLDAVVTPADELPDFDLHVPLLSLPGIFATTLDSIPAQVPYLWPPRPAAGKLEQALKAGDGIKVGLCWSGNAENPVNRLRTCPVELLAPLAGRFGLNFFGLTLTAPPADLEVLAETGAFVDLAPHLESFADTAAALAALDLVISTDTSVPHLAGALGCPTWLLLHNTADWRWQEERPDSPWYPTMRLFRQTAAGDWLAVAAELDRALAALEKR